MADVAFLLLIFFLVTTVFPRDKGLAIVLPRGESPVTPDNVLHFLVRTASSVEVRLGESPQGRFVDFQDVESVWRAAVASNPRLIAAVKTDPDVPYGGMIDVLDRLQTAGATRISLQTLPR